MVLTMPRVARPICCCRSAGRPGRTSSPAPCSPSNCGARRRSLPTTRITAKDSGMTRGWLAAGGCVALIATGAAWAVPSSDPLAAERQRLTAAKQAAEAAQARADRLDAQAGAEQDAAAKAQVEEQAVAARIDKASADIAAAQSRVALVQAELDAQRGVLARRQGPIVRLIAALAGLARRPAIASVAQPGSIDDMVHVRAVPGAVAPVIAQRTAGVRDELARTRALRANAALAAQSLADSRAALDQ